MGPLGSKAEVDYFDFTGGWVVYDVFRFDVPVDDVQSVELLDGLAKLLNNLFYLFLGGSACVDPLFEGDALAPVVDEVVAFLADVAASELGEELAFAYLSQELSLVPKCHYLLIVFLYLVLVEDFYCYF